MSDFCDNSEIANRIICETSQLTTIQQLVAKGLGVSLLPEICAKSKLVSGVKYTRISGDEPKREIAVVWKKGIEKGFLPIQFIEILSAELSRKTRIGA